ncbi:methylated-DNA--[protein]-cysteine S-methyltransferase [Secundilactobacillus folii]|uniref:methylated-DNA--[protein]-cysteine S-methyltransferase n=1 Tax=Secundilactobacillus folii TaxID=2678357 RepID=A0A7X2XVR6_9LACO|nr:methylated-DNA--[protein]-cysteine S-methyltransferase [Secundilactobacillus folii]MTV82582.1 methylated-DNA--[protein]-cysteine S-methyltransferase [Secundilactobacillus folii]
MLRTTYHSPIGKLILLADEHYLLGVWFKGQKYEGSHYDLNNIKVGVSPILQCTSQWLNDYFAGHQPAISDLPLAPRETDFRNQVYKVLMTIPYGKTMTYQQIRQRLTVVNGRPTGSARSVGGAVSHNPISIIIPCHRVVGSDGSLTGYAGGLDRKKALLTFETTSK